MSDDHAEDVDNLGNPIDEPEQPPISDEAWERFIAAIFEAERPFLDSRLDLEDQA